MNNIRRQPEQTPEPVHHHPAEALALFVFEACLRTLARLCVARPLPGDEPDVSDAEFEQELARRTKREPIRVVSKSSFVVPRPVSLAELSQEVKEGIAQENERPDKDGGLSLAELIASNLGEETPYSAPEPDPGAPLRETAHPFPVARVLGWLDSLGMLEPARDGTVRARRRCFDPSAGESKPLVANDVACTVCEWVLSEKSPCGRALPVRLPDAKGRPEGVGDILLVQGIRGPDDALVPLLRTLPLWSGKDRSKFRRIVAGWWLYRLRFKHREFWWQSRSAALYLHRWRFALANLGVEDGKFPGEGRAPVLVESIPSVIPPRQLHEKIGAHVVGQDEAKRIVATAIHYQILRRTLGKRGKSAAGHFPPASVLLAGPTGCGKSLLVSTACRIAGLPFIHVDASQMVPEGIVGRSLNDIGRQLIEENGGGEKGVEQSRHAVIFFDEIDKVLVTRYGSDIASQLLGILEGGDIPLNEGVGGNWKPPAAALPTSQMLVILGGAFQSLFDGAGRAKIGFGAGDKASGTIGLGDLVRAGMPREFLGRIRRWAVMPPLSGEQLETILLESKSSPLAEINDLLGAHGFRLVLTRASARLVARAAMRSGFGARALHQIVHEIADPWMFDAPETSSKSHRITAKEVGAALERLDEKGAFDDSAA